MLIKLFCILSLLSLYIINTIISYKLYKEIQKYTKNMFGVEEYEDNDKLNAIIDSVLGEEPEYTYDNPPKAVNNLFDVDAYRKRMDAMKKEQEQDGLYDIKETVVNDTYFTGVEVPED